MLKIKIVDELPQWIIASDKAAYTPHLKTIWLRKDCKRYVFHELIHWIIDIIFRNKQHRWQVRWDKVSRFAFRLSRPLDCQKEIG